MTEETRDGFRCPACGSDVPSRALVVKEMMFGSGEEFLYRECRGCGTLAITKPPDDLGRYYPDDYYSFNENADVEGDPRLRRTRAAVSLGLRVRLPPAALRSPRVPECVRRLHGLGITKRSSVLDVGCGSGRFLHQLAAAGFRRVEGIDRYVATSRTFGNGVRIRRAGLSDVGGHFDVVMFNHSFEHMSDPLAVLQAARAVAKPGGWILIRVPVADSWAFRHFGGDWAQLDAPRHLLVPTVAGMRELSRASSLDLAKVRHDSTAFGLWASERYRRGIPLNAEADFPTAADKQRLEAEAHRLNAAGHGDQALFALSPR